MGLFGAMTASVSGLGAQGQAISVISDNLANTNTIGYKASRSLFSQLVTSAGANGTAYNSGGVGTSVQRDESAQGSFIASSSKTDLAISGKGYFRVADQASNGTSTSYYYTRAGSFSEDKSGYLVNPDGYYLQGWRTDTDGTVLNVQNLQAVELQSVGVSAQPTTEFSIDANLTSTAALNTNYDTSGSLASSLAAIRADPTLADYTTDVRVYDAQGGARDMTVAFTKRASNVWDWNLYTDGANVQGGTAGTNTALGNGTLEFNTTGTLKYATGTSVTADWSGGVTPSTMTLNFGDYTGGNVVSSASAGLSFTDTTVPAVDSTTIAGANGFDAFSTSLTAGTYTLRRIDATHVALYDSTNTTAVGTDGSVLLTGSDPQTVSFPSVGLSMTTTTGFTAGVTGTADGSPVGTFTVGTTDAGNVRYITSEDTTALSAGTYIIKKTSATTMGLYASNGTTLLDSASIGSSGTREVYFSNSKVRLTVGSGFDETAGTYPTQIGSFTVTTASKLKEGLGSDGVTQLAANYDTNSINQNGFGAGTISSISVDENGFVSGIFTNGEVKKLYKIALAVFQNPGGLEALSGSLLRATDSSGNALMKDAGVGSTGRLVSGSLEGSTTDIAGEFSTMIVAQRAFQASGKVITTVDQMLADLMQLR
ncbi:MAG: flagellar hook-basal body complex protein [Proteobacteria bacterium]|nr:flagellar hook-basal body complex protein [Pseudomonadota bacterium]